MRRLYRPILILALLAAVLGLGGCQKKETKINNKQTLPLVGNPVSPLPTPNTQASPLKR